MEILSELNVIACAQRSITNLTESRVENLSTSFLERNVAAEVSESLRANRVVLLTAENFEDCVDFAFSFWIGFTVNFGRILKVYVETDFKDG